MNLDGTFFCTHVEKMALCKWGCELEGAWAQEQSGARSNFCWLPECEAQLLLNGAWLAYEV